MMVSCQMDRSSLRHDSIVRVTDSPDSAAAASPAGASVVAA